MNPITIIDHRGDRYSLLRQACTINGQSFCAVYTKDNAPSGGEYFVDLASLLAMQNGKQVAPIMLRFEK